jgi:hypothetical protein
MKRIFYTSIFLNLLCSCSLSGSEKEVEDVRNDLQSAFHHNNIRASVQKGSEHKKLAVSFVDYSDREILGRELDAIAMQVKNRILTGHPGFRNMDTIEVKFTGTDATNMHQVRIYQYATR